MSEPLYSNAEKAVSDISMPKAPASQWLSMLDPAKGKGTKADEMKWIGLDDFLKDKGNATVTKQEIQDFIDQNKVQLKEVRKGAEGQPMFNFIPPVAGGLSLYQLISQMQPQGQQ